MDARDCLPASVSVKLGTILPSELNNLLTANSTTVYGKDTHTGQVVNSNSFQPWNLKLPGNRAFRICSDNEMFEVELIKIKQFLQWNYHSNHLSNKLIRKFIPHFRPLYKPITYDIPEDLEPALVPQVFGHQPAKLSTSLSCNFT